MRYNFMFMFNPPICIQDTLGPVRAREKVSCR